MNSAAELISLHRVPQTVPLEAVNALQLQHRLELAKIGWENVELRRRLVEAGLEEPSAEDSSYENCRRVVQAAHELVENLGSAKELLSAWPSR